MIDKETELYEFVKINAKGVTVKQVHEGLSEAHMGAMGKLMQAGKVKKVKLREGEAYSVKVITYYRIKEEEKTNDSQENTA